MRGFLLSIMLFSGPVFAMNEFDPDERIKSVISLLINNKPVEAFDLAVSGNEQIKNQKTEFDQLKYQFAGFVTQVGAPYDCEKLVSRNLIYRYRIDQYLCLSEMQPFVIQFDFL